VPLPHPQLLRAPHRLVLKATTLQHLLILNLGALLDAMHF
jgi:hypothetical protein